MKFNKITQAMLEDYETQYFSVEGGRSLLGGVSEAVANVRAAVNAGWIDEPFPGFLEGKWREEEPDKEKIRLLRDTANALIDKYSELVYIDPNG